LAFHKPFLEGKLRILAHSVRFDSARLLLRVPESLKKRMQGDHGLVLSFNKQVLRELQAAQNLREGGTIL
jgi:hypothetical protein